jgi:hypothetical protein
MNFYNDKMILVDENYQGMKWVTEIDCNLSPEQGKEIVFNGSGWSKIDSNNLLQFLSDNNIINVPPDKKIVNNEIVDKTEKELFESSLLSESEYKEILIDNIIVGINNYYNDLLIHGFILNGYRIKIDDKSKTLMSEAVNYYNTFNFLVPSWISESKVDSNNNDIEGQENAPIEINTIDDLKLIVSKGAEYWTQNFYIRRSLIDSLVSLNLTELENYSIGDRWNSMS